MSSGYIAMTERLISKAQCKEDGHLICRLVSSKIGLSASSSGTHSLKSGAGTVAMASGHDADAIDKYAGCRSKSSKFRYVGDSLDGKLSISDAIGL